MSQPPKQLWESKGDKDGCSTVVLEVRICQDEFDRIWSAHLFQGPSDEQTALGWRGGGAQQIAFALLTEAVRREVYATVLTYLGKEEGFLSTYAQASTEEKTRLEKQVGEAVQAIIARNVGKMGPDAAKEVLSMLAAQVSLSD